MNRRVSPLGFLVGLLLLLCVSRSVAFAQEPVINAVLFFSPTCPHCHQVMNEDLPPLQEQYGEQLRILEVNIQFSDGQAIYNNYLVKYNVPEERLGVPALVVGENYYVGSFEIPQFFPAVIAEGLAGGGISWPELPGLARYLEDHGLSGEARLSVGERFAQDPIGNSISVLVLVGMLVSVVLLGYNYLNGKATYGLWPDWVIPVLALAGLGVATYLSFIELTHTEAVCGPVGDCNAVQTSTYAYLFGVIPVALLGALGFLAIGGAWTVQKLTSASTQTRVYQALWWFALTGTLFSIYLTYLEPFVIGATCAWCLTSAIIMTLILWAATPKALFVQQQPSKKGGKRRYKARQAP